MDLEGFKSAFEAAGDDDNALHRLGFDIYGREDDPSRPGLTLNLEQWKQLLVDELDSFQETPRILSSLLNKAANTLQPNEFDQIEAGLENVIRNANQPLASMYTFARNTDVFQDNPSLVQAILQHARQHMPEDNFDRFVGDLIRNPDTLEFNPEAVKVITQEGLAYFNGTDTLHLPAPRFADQDNPNIDVNMAEILSNIDLSYTSGMIPETARDYISEYGRNPYGRYTEDTHPNMAAHVLTELAEDHPGLMGEVLDAYIVVFGEDKAAEIITEVLERTSEQTSILIGLRKELDIYRRYNPDARSFSPEKMNDIMQRDEVTNSGLTERQVREPGYYITRIGQTHFEMYLKGLKDGQVVRSEKVQTALAENINFELLRENRYAGSDNQSIDEYALRALQHGVPLAEYYVGEYLFGNDPKRILENRVLSYLRDDSGVFEGYMRRGLEALGYDPELLIDVTGKPLKELPYGLIHQTASDETLSEPMLRDPLGEFRANVPAFGEPSDTSETGYVITVEFNRGGNYKPHLMATANIMDRTLAATGQNDITTIAIDAGRSGSDGFLKRGGQLLDGALVVQSSTGTNFNAFRDFGVTNTDLIMVYSAGNDGNKRYELYAEVNLDETEPEDIYVADFNRRADPNVQFNIQDPSTSRHLAVANTVEFGASIYDPELNSSYIADYSNTDGQVFVTIPGFLPNYNFHSKENGPYDGRFESGTSFFSPSGAAYVAEAVARANTEFPDLQPHQILYAMAQTSEHVGVVEGATTRAYPEDGLYGSEIFSVAAPHGVEYNQRGGFGDFRRESFYGMLERMQEVHNELASATPELEEGLSPDITAEETINFDFTQDNIELTPEGVQKFSMSIDLDKITTRPVFTINYDVSALEENGRLNGNDRFWPLKITAPNGASFDYIIDAKDARGMATISAIGFMGAETEGEWTIEAKDPEFMLPVQSIDVKLFTTSKDDLITLPEFRKQHTLDSIVGQDLSHLSDIWIQNGGVDKQGGWISQAVEQGWHGNLDLAGVSMDWNLMQTLPYSDELPTGFKNAEQQTNTDLTSSPIPSSRPWEAPNGNLTSSPRPVTRP